jgi:amidophosphoribosyltransferase
MPVAGHPQPCLHGESKPIPSKVDDHPKDECGVVAVYAPNGGASHIAYTGLFSLQHRGQESAGIAVSDGQTVQVHSDMGLVNQVFRAGEMKALLGTMAIGHTRYSTTGSSQQCNVQPFVVDGLNGQLALGHNGNIIDLLALQKRLSKQWGCEFTSTTDSEPIAYLMANAPGATWEERAAYCMRTLQGAYSAVSLSTDAVMGFRDPLGVRPLCLGELDGGWVMASETCALDHLGATFLRELEPGEIVVIDREGLRSTICTPEQSRRALCIFEYIYLARPDSMLSNRLVYSTRRDMGGRLAQEHPADADVVIGVPDSATAAAVGYAQVSGVPYSDGLIKNRYVGRTFMEPDQQSRDSGVRLKFNPLPEVVQGKRVVLVDDSIVRGTTTPHLVALVRRAGATEVHVRVCSPPIRWPCYLGVDMSTREELIASRKSVEQIREFIGADSLGYLSIGGLLEVVDGEQGGYCDACFTGHYPVPVQLELTDKFVLESARTTSDRLSTKGH